MEKYVGLRNFRLSTKTVGNNKCKGKYLAKKSVTVTNTRLPPRWTGKIVVLQLWLNLPHKSFTLCGSEGWTCYVFSWPGTLAALYHFRILTFVFICPFVFCMLSICILYVVCHTRAYSSSCCWTSVGSSPSQHGTCCKWQRPGIFIKFNMTTKTSNIARGTTDPEIDSVTWD